MGTQEWLPGAKDVLRALRTRGWKVVVLSARAGSEQGKAWIESRLDESGFRGGWVTVVAKPHADVYVDDRNVRFTTWAEVRPLILKG